MVNFFSGLESFIAKWDDYVSYSPQMDKDLPFVRGEQGAINLDGELSCFEASIFSRGSLLFEGVIEDGIKSLVLFLIDSMNCITYTSCQGHIIDPECNALKYRSVGLLPRNKKEYKILLKKLNNVDNLVNEVMIDNFVKVVIEENFVDSEMLHMPCIDILFLPKQGYENKYFTDLEQIYQKFLELIKQEFQAWSAKVYA